MRLPIPPSRPGREYSPARIGEAPFRYIELVLKQENVNTFVRTLYFNTLLDGITSGHIDRGDIHEYAVLARNASNATNAASRTITLTTLLFRPTVEMYGAEAIGALLSMHPVIGSILSAFEAATGRNVAGQQLSNWQRGMAVGFAIFPFARQAKSGQMAAQIANRLSFLSTTTVAARQSRLAQAGDFVRACRNSFSGDTPVRTIAGLVTISALTLGTPVLAYNEATGEQGYYPVTDVISYGVQEQPITYLSIRSQDGGDEVIKATPNHPFYLVDSVDGGERPQPEGYNLGANWVGAGDLKIGDTVRRADGSTGTVVQTATVGETRQVYNLTVNTAHTYFVGEREWLVHNTVCSPILTRFGYTGSRQYRSVVDTVRTNSNTITEIIVGRDSLGRTISAIPNRQEAERLIAEAGGRVLRVERAHPAPGHTYPHINYTIDGKHVVTIRVEGVGREYQGPGQNNYRGNPRR